MYTFELIETLPLYWSNAKTLVDRHSFDLHLNISFYLRIFRISQSHVSITGSHAITGMSVRIKQLHCVQGRISVSGNWFYFKMNDMKHNDFTQA